ncbi:unnamed protein product, partial [Didymodactylos carnosus]
DVIQTELMQILSIVAMEKPRSMKAEDIRNEKVRVLRSILPIKTEDVVIGQYVGDKFSTDPERRKGYLDDEGVPKDSTTPTYAQVVLSINNERWAGVPFILRKALNEKKIEIRIQFHDVPGGIFDEDIRRNNPNGRLARNELVIRFQPDEVICLKINIKRPGEMDFSIEEANTDLTHDSRHGVGETPDRHGRLILDAFMGPQLNFVCPDELPEYGVFSIQYLIKLTIKKYQSFHMNLVVLIYIKHSKQQLNMVIFIKGLI